MASQKYARPHVQRMKKYHEQHKKQILKFVHAIRRHPGAYKPGYKPSRAAFPKSFPKKPAGLHKEASGFFDFAKKGWNWIKSKFHQHKGKIIDHAKKVAVQAGSRVASRVGSAAKRVGSKVLDRMEAVAENNIEHYVSKAEGKIDAMGKKAEAKLSKWVKPKKGSGYVGDFARRVAGRGGRSSMWDGAKAAGRAVRAYSRGRRGVLRGFPIDRFRQRPMTIGGVKTRLLAGRRGVPQRTK